MIFGPSPRLPQRLLSSRGRVPLLTVVLGGLHAVAGFSSMRRPSSGPPRVQRLHATNEVMAGAEGVALEASEFEHILAVENFLDEGAAAELRATFEGRFRSGMGGADDEADGSIPAERFVWDLWHVPNQFSLMRTPAEEYFKEDGQFDGVVDALTAFGQRYLGCNSISPVWLSLYTDGCEQRLHTDAWQGPWSFVLSLTDWERRGFDGGETVILRPETLDHWRGFDAGESLEEQHMVDEVEPLFNRLTVFDPRFPHGVRTLRGSRDPMRGRLVLHGWFTQPAPFFEGPLDEDQAADILNDALQPFFESMADTGRLMGMLAVRIHVSGETGEVRSVEALSDTLLHDPFEHAGPDEAASAIATVKAEAAQALRGATFPTAPADTMITMPFVFE